MQGSAGEANVRLVELVLDAFNRRDVEAVLAAADPKIAFFAPTAVVADRRHDLYRGYEGIRLYFDDVARQWDDLRIEPDDYRHGDDCVVAVGTARGRTADGTTFESRVAWAWRVEEGKISWGRVYTNPDDALGDLGLQ